ncbi:MAG: bifunctional diaminohydroxyphosphoribosylaminopyrimidine deaminase/5-amino-6-(5-phosphoribosylamino)uracil reductase RibD [Desulfobacterales bacterium]|nr:bifunctional diaminohydroxyphosphoribosylaminopyrimidine deaminase/5-amino-6-(5-phosphoribosylamino)uracil reductase RibD [Desulfobacterales bacterium]
MKSDFHYMRQALKLARKGLGRTSPNPCVGALVVNNGVVVGQGYHKKAGTPHAEIHAINDAGLAARGATIYVTLEPCNHTGRTPPCTRAIVAAGISRVVIGSSDPNPRVSGGGAAFLAGQGLEVVSGVLENECRQLIAPFVKHSSTGLPWVIMKAGISLDGRIAAVPGQPLRITNQRSGRAVHRLRDQVDAILVGIDTVLADDPCLTVRLAKARQPGDDPLRVVLDTGLRMEPAARMLSLESAAATWIFCGPGPDPVRRHALEEAGARVIPVAVAPGGGVDLKEVLAELGRAQLSSLLVEGGGRVHGSFLQAGLVDQVFLYVAPIFIGQAGVPLVSFSGETHEKDVLRLHSIRTRRLGDDILIQGLCSHGG